MPISMDHSPLGFVFFDYKAYRPISNIRADQILQQAMTAVAVAPQREPFSRVQTRDQRRTGQMDASC